MPNEMDRIQFWFESKMNLTIIGGSAKVEIKSDGRESWTVPGSDRSDGAPNVRALIQDYCTDLMRKANAGEELAVMSSDGRVRVSPLMPVTELHELLDSMRPETAEISTYDVELLTADVPTPTGRVYSKEAFSNSLKEMDECINSGGFFGEVRLPNDLPKSMMSCVTVLWSRAAFKLMSYRWEENILKGTIEILNTKFGKILEDELDLAQGETADRNVAMALRGFGQVVDVGGQVVVLPGFKITAWDAVIG